MRRQEKKKAEDYLQTLFGNQTILKQAMKKHNIPNAMDWLGKCQKTAIELGTLIERAEGEGFSTVAMLEDYCETAYQLYESLGSSKGITDELQLQDAMARQLEQIRHSVRCDIKERLEVVFLPYKASMWDCLESVWKAADQDEDCDAYVVPIPYYDRKLDKSLGEMHDEGEKLPDYVPITKHDEYDIAKRRPDMIFIHNPYDQYNQVTSVAPFYYAKNLKQYTECLVYIPYFTFGSIPVGNEEAMEKVKDFCGVAAVLNSHRVIVESEEVRQVYIDTWTEMVGENSRGMWERKILALGSPKIEKIRNTKKEEVSLPKGWLDIIQKPDGDWKKIVLYNTSVKPLLAADEDMLIAKMRDVLQTFKKWQAEIALIWRPHPLIPATISSLRPTIRESYDRLVQEYRAEGWGIYDDTGDVDRAVVLCDAYYGDSSSVVLLARQLGKPIMLQRLEPRKKEDED